MKAFRIGKTIIAADLEQMAVYFYLAEIGEAPLGKVEEIWVEEKVPGRSDMIKDEINRVLNERSMWLRMGVPADLDCPFFIYRE